jgi:hypothetical protein
MTWHSILARLSYTPLNAAQMEKMYPYPFHPFHLLVRSIISSVQGSNKLGQPQFLVNRLAREIAQARKACIIRLLTLLMHALLRRHGIRARSLGGLLLLQVGLILQGLLLVGSHPVRLAGCRVAHLLRHRLRHGWSGGMLLLGRVDR